MVGAAEVSFFDSLSLVGWLGIVLWILFIVFVLVKYDTFLNYDERIPKIDIFDEYIYEDWHKYLFMVARFLLMVFVLYIITKIMFMI